MPSRPLVQHVEFEPRAADFVELLRDLGHLDPASLDKLAAEFVRVSRPDRRIAYEEVRRAVATWLFDHEPELRPEQRELLAVEWPRLFY
jgi:hypothetical protein